MMIVKVPAHVQEGRLLSLESVQKQKVYGSVVVICVLHYRLKKKKNQAFDIMIVTVNDINQEYHKCKR